MILADFATATPYAIGFLGGGPIWFALGRVDWLLGARYWRDVANQNRRFIPPPATAQQPPAATAGTNDHDDQADAA